MKNQLVVRTASVHFFDQLLIFDKVGFDNVVSLQQVLGVKKGLVYKYYIKVRHFRKIVGAPFNFSEMVNYHFKCQVQTTIITRYIQQYVRCTTMSAMNKLQ